MRDIHFGTDGWRAVISQDYTFHNLERISQATSDFLIKGAKKPRIIVGYDTRFMSQIFAQRCSEVFAGNSIEVVFSKEFCSTPCVSFTTRYKNFDLGIVITASHNPYYFNGFKIKTSQGGAAPKSLTDEVERFLDKHPVKKGDYASLKQKGLIKEKDIKSYYIKFIRDYVDLKSLKHFQGRVLIDTMYGSAQGLMEKVLEGLNIKIEFLRNNVNPYFDGSRPEPIEENLKGLVNSLKRGSYSLGIAFDGDGDRLASVLRGGIFLHPQKILPLLLFHLRESRGWKGCVVKTVVGSMLIDRVCQALGLEVVETPIGFKYISEVFGSRDVLIGGEEAGGIGVKNYIPERDGLMCACLLMEMSALRRKSLGEIVKEFDKRFGRFYYLRSDLRLGERFKGLNNIEIPTHLKGKKVLRINRLDGIKFITKDSWLMLRKSGTEPLVRIYSEATSLKEAKELISLGKKLLSRCYTAS